MSDFREERVLAVRPLSETVRVFTISYEEPFLPGQFVILDLPINHEFTTRSYSIASTCNGKNIELCVVHKPDGAGSGYLFDTIKEGTLLKVSSPQGKFILDEERLSASHTFICTGTGVAPFRPMIDKVLKEGQAEVFLVFGNREERDILYKEEWEELQRLDSRFHFIPVLSRASETWAGARGYVHPHYLELASENSDMMFYICGWSDMVREAKNNLKALGFGRKQLKFELYD